MKKILLLLPLAMVGCGVNTPQPAPTTFIDEPRYMSPAITPTSAPTPTPTICPSSQNPIRTPPQALPPSAGACPP